MKTIKEKRPCHFEMRLLAHASVLRVGVKLLAAVMPLPTESLPLQRCHPFPMSKDL